MRSKLVAAVVATPVLLLAVILASGSLHSPGSISNSLVSSGSPSSIYLVSSGLVYSDSLTRADTQYWDLNGSAVGLDAPHSYAADSSGLKLYLLAHSAKHWAGYYAASPLTPARLFHARITLGDARPTSGLLDTAVYVQQQMVQDPRIDAMGCGADIYPNLTHWTISLQAGDQWHEIVPQTIYTDNSPNQPSSRECTLVTDGNHTLTAYIDNQKVFSSSKMNLNMPEPFQYYIELQTNSVTPSASTGFTGTFSDYYATSSDSITVLNVQQGSRVKIIDDNSGKTLAASVANTTNQAILDVGMYHMPINAAIKVFDSSEDKVLTSANITGMYGGDVYSVGGFDLHRPTVKIISHDQSINEDFDGAYTNVSSSSDSFVSDTPIAFSAAPYQPYVVSTTNDQIHKFVKWENGLDTNVRVLRTTTSDQQLIAYYTGDQTPSPPTSLTSLTQYTTNIKAPSITGNGIPDFSVQLYDNSRAVGEPAIVSDNGTWIIKLPRLPDGAHVITATETDLTGQSSMNKVSANSGPITMAVDTIPPSVTVSGGYTPYDNATVRGTATDTVVGVKSVDIQIDHGKQFFPADQRSVGDWSNWLFESAQLIPGHHTITARVTNLAGGQAFASMSLSIPPPDPSILVTSVDTVGSPVMGMWTVLNHGDTFIKTGFTPVDFKTNLGGDYSIIAADYGDNYFDHWHDSVSGQDIHNRTITVSAITNPIQLTAVFRYTALPYGSSVMVSGSDLIGNAVNGMHMVLTDANHDAIHIGYTPVYFATTSGHSYVLSASDYGDNYFDHWHDSVSGHDTYSRSIALVASNGATQMTAIYRHTP